MLQAPRVEVVDRQGNAILLRVHTGLKGVAGWLKAT